MPTKNPRMTLTLQPETLELLTWLSKETKVPEATIVSKLLGAHLTELWEYRTWLEQLPRDSRKRDFGLTLLHSYGPDTLVDAIKELDPHYKTMEDRYKEAAEAPMTPEEQAELLGPDFGQKLKAAKR